MSKCEICFNFFNGQGVQCDLCSSIMNNVKNGNTNAASILGDGIKALKMKSSERYHNYDTCNFDDLNAFEQYKRSSMIQEFYSNAISNRRPFGVPDFSKKIERTKNR